MTDARGKLIDIILDNKYTVERCADAILAALPDMVPDLVWRHTNGRTELICAPTKDGCVYTIRQEANRLVVRYGAGIIATCDDWKSAKAEANVHHRATWFATLTGGTT